MSEERTECEIIKDLASVANRSFAILVNFRITVCPRALGTDYLPHRYKQQNYFSTQN